MNREQSCWWLADRSRAAERVTAMAEALLSSYGRELRTRMHCFRAVYRNEEHRDFGRIGYHESLSKYPVTQGGVDSLHAKLCLSRPRPKIVPCSRRFKAKRRAKMLQRWWDGLARKNDTGKLQDEQLHDAQIYGAGVIKVVEKHGTICHERRHPGDILTDPREERRSSVRSLFEIANVDREVLAESAFIDGSDMRRRVLDVSSAPEPDDISDTNDGVALDQVRVIEGWRLGPSPDSPGRHVIACGPLLLLDEEWHWDCFPFSVLIWGRDPERSFQGQGIVERGLRVQAMLNHHCRVIDEAFERFVPKYAVSRQSEVDATVINRQVGQLVEFNAAGGAPGVLSPGPISPDFLGYAAELANRWFAVTGVSQMDARSEADQNLESGKAKLVQSDINSTRFYIQGKSRERACVRLAELSIRLADDLYEGMEHEEQSEPDESPLDYGADIISAYPEPEKPGPLDVPAGKDSWRNTIPYGDARMSGEGDEAYEIEVWPVAALSQTISGRMEEISQLVDGGYITNPDTARELLDMPILGEYQDLASARREAAEREIDRCLDGEQGTPSVYMDLSHALERATQELCLAGIDDAPDEVMDALRTFVGATEALITANTAPPPEAMPAPGAPMPPPAPMGPEPMPGPMGPMAAA